MGNRSDCHLSVVEMNIQKSGSECGVFSLVLVKKLYHESDRVVSIHKKNLKRNFTLTPAEADKYLPATFYKHTQGMKRLDSFVMSNPDAKNEIINKKG